MSKCLDVNVALWSRSTSAPFVSHMWFNFDFMWLTTSSLVLYQIASNVLFAIFCTRNDVDVSAVAQDMGLKQYRLSIAMPRIFPGSNGPANEDGIAFYNRLINCLLVAGITPVVTLYHWDLPLELEEDHGGWQSDNTTQRFVEYAELCFERFGDRVKNW